MQKIAEADSKQQVRNIKFHVKIKDDDLLGLAINDIVGQRTSGRIEPSGRGYKPPTSKDYNCNIYTSTQIYADQNSFPRDEKSEFIFTMDDVVFSTEIVVKGDVSNYEETEMDITLSGGWIKFRGEYVLVTFTKKGAPAQFTDYQKMQGRTFYNAIFTRYVTHAIGEDILELRSFDVRSTKNDYPDIKNSFDRASQAAIDILRGKTPPAPAGGANPFAGGGGKPKVNEKAPDFVNKNYFLYDRKNADVHFAYKDPTAPAKPFNQATDPGINFHFNFPDFVTDEVANVNGVSYNVPADRTNPGDVEISFNNVPRNMPSEIFSSIYDYLKDGLGAQELQAGTNLTYGNTIFKMDPSHGQESLSSINSKKIQELLKEINELFNENREYKVDFDSNVPVLNKAKGVRKNMIQYLNELEFYVKELKKNLPMSLAELDQIIETKGEYAINPKNINLLKIIKKQYPKA